MAAFQCGKAAFQVAVVVDGVFVLAAFQRGEAAFQVAVIEYGVFVLTAFQSGKPLLDCAVVVGRLALVASRADDGCFGNGHADGFFADFTAFSCCHGRDARRDVQLTAQISLDVLAADGSEVVFGGCVRDGGGQGGREKQADDVAVNGQRRRDGCAVWEFDGQRKRQAVGLQRLACFAGQGDFEKMGIALVNGQILGFHHKPKAARRPARSSWPPKAALLPMTSISTMGLPSTLSFQ